MHHLKTFFKKTIKIIEFNDIETFAALQFAACVSVNAFVPNASFIQLVGALLATSLFHSLYFSTKLLFKKRKEAREKAEQEKENQNITFQFNVINIVIDSKAQTKSSVIVPAQPRVRKQLN